MSDNEDYVRQEFKGKMYNIFSGNLAKVGWEWDSVNKCGVFRAEFVKGSVYDYWPVTKELFSEIFKVESKGSWFQTNIVKNQSLSYEKVNTI